MERADCLCIMYNLMHLQAWCVARGENAGVEGGVEVKHEIARPRRRQTPTRLMQRGPAAAERGLPLNVTACKAVGDVSGGTAQRWCYRAGAVKATSKKGSKREGRSPFLRRAELGAHCPLAPGLLPGPTTGAPLHRSA